MRRALVLSGGGSKGAFEVGAVDYLVNKAGLDFDIFLGTSAGALNASFLGQSQNRRELADLTRDLKELWLNIKGTRSIYKKNFFGFMNLLFRKALYKPDGLRSLLKQYIDPERLFDPAKVVKVATVSIETGELFYADSRNTELKPKFLDYILASTCVPLFFPAVQIDGKHWFDGGLRDLTPVRAVFNERPDEIVVIITYPVTDDLKPVMSKTSPRGPVKSLLRLVDILTNEIAAGDLQLASLMNMNLCNPQRRRPVPIYLIAPDGHVHGEHPLDFNPVCIRENIRRGYAAAMNPKLLGQGRILSNAVRYLNP